MPSRFLILIPTFKSLSEPAEEEEEATATVVVDTERRKSCNVEKERKKTWSSFGPFFSERSSGFRFKLLKNKNDENIFLSFFFLLFSTQNKRGGKSPQTFGNLTRCYKEKKKNKRGIK